MFSYRSYAYAYAYVASVNQALVTMQVSTRIQPPTSYSFPGSVTLFRYTVTKFNFIDSPNQQIKPGSYERKRKINTKTKHYFSFGTREDKTTIIFFCFAFCSALGLCLDAYAYDDPYVAGLTSFLCFALMLMLMLSCEPGLNQLTMISNV